MSVKKFPSIQSSTLTIASTMTPSPKWSKESTASPQSPYSVYSQGTAEDATGTMRKMRSRLLGPTRSRSKESARSKESTRSGSKESARSNESAVWHALTRTARILQRRKRYDDSASTHSAGDNNHRPRAISGRAMWGEVPSLLRRAPTHWRTQDLMQEEAVLMQVSTHENEVLRRVVERTYAHAATSDRGGTLPSRLNVEQVYRVENMALWKRYIVDRHAIQVKRSQQRTLLRKLPGGDALTNTAPRELERHINQRVNEVFLWFGTDPSTANDISLDGFKLPSLDFEAAGIYGCGVEFTDSSSRADEHALEDEAGEHPGLFCLVLCRVVLGEVLHLPAGGGATTAAKIASALEAGRCDSVLGVSKASTGLTFRDFVVYEEAMAFPEYLVLYTREFDSALRDADGVANVVAV